jgi:hypothetical protein
MVEPPEGFGRFSTCALPLFAARRARLEPLGSADETEIHQDAFGMRAAAGFGPSLLVSARACALDAQTYARAGGEIDGASTRFATQKPIRNQCLHATHASVQSARPQKQPKSRGLASERCRNFV